MRGNTKMGPDFSLCQPVPSQRQQLQSVRVRCSLDLAHKLVTHDGTRIIVFEPERKWDLDLCFFRNEGYKN